MKKEKASAFLKIKNDIRLVELLRRLRVITVWTDERKMLEFQLFFHYTSALKALSKLKKLSLKQMKYLTVDEMIGGEEPIILGKKADYRIKNPFLEISKNGVIEFASNAKYSKLKKVINKQEEIKEIVGQVAYKRSKNIYFGKVKIALAPHQAVKVKEGDFLVSNMTTPQYIFAMKKAKGFITDEGGVTCHAAIVAREMNKPCIIGTKNATRILKDGMLIQMDTEKGIVKKV
jgi:phosphohistidine swiveling domain-containing protein